MLSMTSLDTFFTLAIIWFRYLKAIWLVGLRGRSFQTLSRYRFCHLPPAGTPLSLSRRKPKWVRAEVLRLAAQLPAHSCRRIADAFNLIHSTRMTVGKTWVHEFVKAHRHEIECAMRDLRRRKPKPVPVNSVWGLDMTGITDTTGKQHGILGIIDHGSRVSVRLQALANKCSWTLVGHLCMAIGLFGKPRSVRTDNERVFTSFVFRTALALLGIRHQRTQLNSPWQNGRIERFWATLKPPLVQLAIPGRLALQSALDEFGLFYNCVRTHRNLDGLTPAMAWRGETWQELKASGPKSVVWVSALDGLLNGFYIRR